MVARALGPLASPTAVAFLLDDPERRPCDMISTLQLQPLHPQDADWRILTDLLTLADLPTSDLEDGGQFFVMQDAA